MPRRLNDPDTRRATRAALLAAMLLAGCPSALALNPALDVSQYAHTAWKIRDGFVKGSITSIVQTPDGYLWLGTEFGVLRFDGVRTTPLVLSSDQHLPSNDIRRLLVARDGTLWIATSQGLASLKGGRLTHVAELAGRFVGNIVEDREGSVWTGDFGLPIGRLCAIRARKVQCFGEDGVLGHGVTALYEDSHGNLWVRVQNGLWRWKPGPPELIRTFGEADDGAGLGEDSDGALLIGTRTGILRLADGRMEAYPFPGAQQQFHVRSLLRDRDGGLWIGTLGHGLIHVHEGRTDHFTTADGLSGNYVYSLIEDREDNIWARTESGLDRFRDFAVRTFSSRQGLFGDIVGSVLAGRDGSVWIATYSGLNRWMNGEIIRYRQRSAGAMNGVREIVGSGLPDEGLQSLFQDSRGRIWISMLRGVGYLERNVFILFDCILGCIVQRITEDARGNLWIANQDLGLFRVGTRPARDDVQLIPWASFGGKTATVVVADPMRSGFWLGFFQGGVAYVEEGRVVASYEAANGLGEGRVNALQLDQDGTLWAATEGGLSRVKSGRIATLTSRNGLPCDAVHWAMEDSARTFWLSAPCGLARVPRIEVDACADSVERDRNANRTIHATVFDGSDGVRSLSSAGGYTPQVIKSSDGRLWFGSLDGVSVVDPRHLPFNSLPPPVQIERVTADRTAYDLVPARVRLPALTRDLQIDYTALSFVAPEKNRFRYKLDGYDRDWQDVGTRRQAFYNNLPPRSYRFRVVASNNSGVWNEAGAALDFSIAPAYYQTTWLRSTMIVAALALLWVLHEFRLRRIAYPFAARLHERVNARTRIARDLHDTLLQSFHGLLFRFQAATNMLPESEVKQKFETAIDQAAQAIAEGRDAVQNLRASTTVTNDLAEAIGTLGAELAAAQTAGAGGIPGINDPKTRPTLVDVAVEGTSRDLHPIIRDDIYRIAGEALRNAFRHARARDIEVQIRYDDAQLRVRVRDDGKGIDPTVRDQQRPGHFGLPGMRERAELVGGHLTVWSEVGLGTEVELTIPAAAAYATPRASGRSWLFVKKLV